MSVVSVLIHKRYQNIKIIRFAEVRKREKPYKTNRNIKKRKKERKKIKEYKLLILVINIYYFLLFNKNNNIPR